MGEFYMKRLLRTIIAGILFVSPVLTFAASKGNGNGLKFDGITSEQIKAFIAREKVAPFAESTPEEALATWRQVVAQKPDLEDAVVRHITKGNGSVSRDEHVKIQDAWLAIHENNIREDERSKTQREKALAEQQVREQEERERKDREDAYKLDEPTDEEREQHRQWVEAQQKEDEIAEQKRSDDAQRARELKQQQEADEKAAALKKEQDAVEAASQLKVQQAAKAKLAQEKQDKIDQQELDAAQIEANKSVPATPEPADEPVSAPSDEQQSKMSADVYGAEGAADRSDTADSLANLEKQENDATAKLQKEAAVQEAARKLKEQQDAKIQQELQQARDAKDVAEQARKKALADATAARNAQIDAESGKLEAEKKMKSARDDFKLEQLDDARFAAEMDEQRTDMLNTEETLRKAHEQADTRRRTAIGDARDVRAAESGASDMYTPSTDGGTDYADDVMQAERDAQGLEKLKQAQLEAAAREARGLEEALRAQNQKNIDDAARAWKAETVAADRQAQAITAAREARGLEELQRLDGHMSMNEVTQAWQAETISSDREARLLEESQRLDSQMTTDEVTQAWQATNSLVDQTSTAVSSSSKPSAQKQKTAHVIEETSGGDWFRNRFAPSPKKATIATAGAAGAAAMQGKVSGEKLIKAVYGKGGQGYFVRPKDGNWASPIVELPTKAVEAVQQSSPSWGWGKKFVALLALAGAGYGIYKLYNYYCVEEVPMPDDIAQQRALRSSNAGQLANNGKTGN